MSGYYNILLISLGIISCAFCVYVAKRGKIIDDEGLPIPHQRRRRRRRRPIGRRATRAR